MKRVILTVLSALVLAACGTNDSDSTTKSGVLRTEVEKYACVTTLSQDNYKAYFFKNRLTRKETAKVYSIGNNEEGLTLLATLACGTEQGGADPYTYCSEALSSNSQDRFILNLNQTEKRGVIYVTNDTRSFNVDLACVELD
jgi:hypothetical protein